MATAKVNDKSTKAEIWDAYRQLLQELQSRPVTVSEDPGKLQKMTNAMLDVKAMLVGQFDAAIERLGAIQQAYAEADQELSRRKAAALDTIEHDKQLLEISVETIRKTWEQEKADRETQRQREEETYAYNLSRKRRDEQEAHDHKIREKESALAAREQVVAEREQHTAELSGQVEAFPGKIEAETKAAREEIAKTLKAEHDAIIKDLKQQSDHEKSILNLKLQTSEAAIASQSKQITDLQRQLDAASAQLKDMAVTVIQAKNTPAPTTQP